MKGETKHRLPDRPGTDLRPVDVHVPLVPGENILGRDKPVAHDRVETLDHPLEPVLPTLVGLGWIEKEALRSSSPSSSKFFEPARDQSSILIYSDCKIAKQINGGRPNFLFFSIGLLLFNKYRTVNSVTGEGRY